MKPVITNATFLVLCDVIGGMSRGDFIIQDSIDGDSKNAGIIPTTEEMPTPEKYKNQRKVKNKMKKKRGY